MTLKGVEKLKFDIERYKKRLIGVRQKKGNAAEVGGDVWHDNSALEELEHQERILMREIFELNNTLRKAEIVDNKLGDNKVSIGSKVKITFLDDNSSAEFTIAGHGESDPENNIISYDSPLGAALYGKNIGGKCELKTSNNCRSIRVDKIN